MLFLDAAGWTVDRSLSQQGGNVPQKIALGMWDQLWIFNQLDFPPARLKNQKNIL